MPSPYDLFEETRKAVDDFMAGEGLNADIEAPHCRECDDWHWGPCLNSPDQPASHLGDEHVR